MLTKISKAVAGVLSRANHTTVNRPDTYTLEDNPAALAYLARRRELGRAAFCLARHS